MMRAWCAALGCLFLLSPGAAHAADTGANGQAGALQGNIGTQAVDSGTYGVTDDGSGPVSSGNRNPAMSVLGDQSVVGAGVLAQDATAGSDGVSAACAGVAGEGSTLVAVGSDRCIEPNGILALDLATLDLAQLLDGQVVTGTGSVGDLLDLLLPGVAETVVAELDAGLADAGGRVGDVRVFLDLGVVEARCNYDDGGEGEPSVTGSSHLANAQVRVRLPDSSEQTTALTLADGPDGSVTAVLPDLSDAVLGEVRQALDARLDALGVAVDPIQEALVAAVVGLVQPAVDELEGAGILDVDLDQQVRGAGGSLAVTALSVTALTALTDLGGPAVELDIARVECGPSDRAAAPVDPVDPTDPGDPIDQEDPTDPATGPGDTTVVPVTDPAGDPGDPAAPGSSTPRTDAAGTPVPTAVDAGATGLAAMHGPRLLGFLAGIVAVVAAAVVARRRT